MNDTILITGASGFLGRRLVQYLQRTTDAYVITTSRQQESYLNHLVRDLDKITPELTQHVDTVIHCAWQGNEMNSNEEMYQENLNNSLRLLSLAIQSGVKRFIFISSVAVHGDHTKGEEVISEQSVINPQSFYATSKYAVEEALKELCINKTINLIIVRLPMIYHIDNKGCFKDYLNMIKDNHPLPLANINNRRTMLALCNFESALGAILNDTTIRHETFIIADSFAQSTTDILKGTACVAELPIKLFYVPKGAMRVSLGIKGRKDEFRRLWGDYRISSQYAQDKLNWKPCEDFIANLSN